MTAWMLALCTPAILAALFLSAGARATEAPPGKPLLQTWPMAEYRGQVQNWGLAQADDGRMLVGNGSGLLRFDGASWSLLPMPQQDRVRVLEVDEAGRVWVGSPDEFGWFEAAADGGWEYRSLSASLPESQKQFGETRAIARIGDRTYFQALRHLFVWDGRQLQAYETPDKLFRLALVHQQRWWVLIGDRLHDFTEFPEAGDLPAAQSGYQLPKGPRITFLQGWDTERLLLGTLDDGLFWLSESATEPVAVAADLAGSWPFTAMPLADGSWLLGTRHRGLFWFDAQGHLVEHLTRRTGLPADTIDALALDHQGGLWLAQAGAISRLDLHGPRVYDADFGLQRADTLATHQGALLVGGAQGVGVLAADGSDASRWHSLDAPLLEVFGLLDQGDTVLVSGSEGVHEMRFDLDSYRTVASERLLPDTYGYKLIPSRLHRAVYAELESGLGVLSWVDGKWSTYKVDGITRRVHTVVEGPAGQVWAGTTAGVIYRLAWQNDQLALKATLDADDGVPPGYAWAFALADRILFGTSEGAYRLAADGSRIEPDPQFQNAYFDPPRNVYRIHQPAPGRLLAGVGPGGALWSGQRQPDGQVSWQGRWLGQLEPGQNWFITTQDGFTWIGRYPGLFRVRDHAPDEPARSRLNLLRVGYPEHGEWLRAGPDAAGGIEPLAQRTDSLRFEYALANFERPDRTQYRVRLEGLEPEWSRWSGETQRDYTNLPGGQYRLHVEARDLRGAVAAATPYAFRVLPPAHLAPLALVGYTLLALSLLALASRLGQRHRERHLQTERVRLEHVVAERTAEVRSQAREIGRLSAARARFFANVSHELRTPLTLTRAPLQELARGACGELGAEAKQHVEMALRNAEAMQSLIGQVLDIERLAAGRMQLALAEVNLAERLRAQVERFALQARRRDIALVLNGADSSLQAVCDAAHLDTILSNLLSNALKFTPAGGTVEVSLKHLKGHFEIRVADNGPGIAEVDQARIFDRFEQGAHADPGQPGTGIGLALARELAELHQGEVRLHSRPGEGACFTVSIPDDLRVSILPGDPSVPSPAAAVPQSHVEPDTAAGSEEDRPSILLVDDNAELRDFLRLRLGRSYRIIEAGDGETGLLLAREHIPDLVVCDGMMPRMDGLAMTAAIKGDPELGFVPVLMLTARTAKDDIVRGLQAGADDYLPKPFDTAELAARIAGLIATRRRLREQLQQRPRATGAPVSNTASAFLRSIDALLDAQLAEPTFSVRDWAELMHMDRTTLFRRLKAEAGCAPEEYLRSRRLQKAAELLADRAGNVAEVADAVGFASVSHFSRRFRERYGKSPSAWAREPG